MPLLIQAVPLAKNWHGSHYWRTPDFDTFPEELEKLNLIALRTYPTIWPNIIFLLFFLGLTGAAGYALSKIGSSNLAILGQGICFLLPIAIVVWVKVRKDTKARARRRFKHQSQKVLRVWTTQDTQSNAMQWKIRLRPKSVASPWLAQTRRTRRRRSSNQPQQPPQQRRHQQQEQELDQLQDHGRSFSLNEQQRQQHFHAGTTVISMTDALQIDHHQTPDDHEGSDIATLHRVSWVDPRHRREHPTQGPQEGDQDQRPPSFIRHTPEEPSSTVTPPSPIVSLYETFRVRTQRGRTTSVDSTNTTNFVTHAPQQQDTDISPSTATTTETNTPNISPVSSSIPSATTDESPTTTFATGASIWSIFRECLGNSLCQGFCFVEPKVWLIEISLRECQLDEYALMVPSPVYCDYRLPGYDDVIAGAGGSAGESSGIAAAASSSRTGLNRYNGLPPAYESESESEGEDDDDLDDEDDDEDDDLESDDIEAQIQDSTGCRLTRPTPVHLLDIGTGSNSASASTIATNSLQPPMEMIQRPFEMTSIIALATPQPSATTPPPPPTRLFPFNTYGSSSSQEYTPNDPRHMTQSSISLTSIIEVPAGASK
ncbi:hypothetical protein EC957_008301 [Mortierella hygrophila]|uniref:Uncharacterized protein n=1 Tax=Mortierella hygrophila TaxID=979708 RepID=A0A9P6EXP3_9FUNG|nr:hypothetical protein EC957_008301 [Mortierella hygrophila]